MTVHSFANGDKPAKVAYQYSIDLTQAKDDKVTVNLLVQPSKQKEIIYYLPKIVPGTYANYDFGRFISDFTVRDKKGKILPVEKLDANSWKIKEADQMNRITYTVEDTWDTELVGDFVFEPGGTNIEENKNFVLNNHGFFGYFEGMKRAPYEVNVIKPEGFYGSTSLEAAKVSKTTDTYYINSYNELVDSPIMYNKPDTAVLHVGGAEILVSVYSPNKVLSAKDVASTVGPMLNAQKDFLGGKLPIKKYAFLIYLFDKPTKSGSMGALEHSYSSMYCLPEAGASQLAQTVRDVASHEFFHILTPLSIHAEQIHNFDFNKPEMSKHLWLYEGVTEYFAGLMQVKQGLITQEQYMNMLIEKFHATDQFNDTLPFTVMSKECLDVQKDQYGNVYQKGALIGLCLDIKLRELSGGKYGMQNLMADLSKLYGKDKAFKDDELFDQITKMTYPEIRPFFARYVEGNEPLPLQEVFAKTGFSYQDKAMIKDITLGNLRLGYNKDTERLTIDTSEMNEFGKMMGYQNKDEVISFNTAKTAQEVYQALQNFKSTAKEGDPLNIVVARKDAQGKETQVKLSGKVKAVEAEQRHVFKPMENPSPEQLALRDAWLKPQK